MKKFLSDSKYILLFFFALTAATVFSIANTEAESAISQSPAELITAEPVAKVSFPKSQRHPSSLSEVKNELVTVSFPCDEKSQNVQKSTRDQFIMLNVSLCENDSVARIVSLINKTNGFKAQIFKMSDKNFRTDFIQLNKGINLIELETVPKDGQKRVQTLEMLSGT